MYVFMYIWGFRARQHLRSLAPVMKWWLMIMMANNIRGPCGPKASWHSFYRWGKPRKKPHPVNLSRPGIEPGPAAWQARMLPLAPQRWTGEMCDQNWLCIDWNVAAEHPEITSSLILRNELRSVPSVILNQIPEWELLKRPIRCDRARNHLPDPTSVEEMREAPEQYNRTCNGEKFLLYDNSDKEEETQVVPAFGTKTKGTTYLSE